MIIFIRNLILLGCISVHHSFSVLIIDIEPYDRRATFYDRNSQPVSVYNSFRVLTFDTDAQKITHIDFLAFDPRSTEYYQFALGYFCIKFKPSDTIDFTITPFDGFKGIIRKCGDFTCNLSTRNVQAIRLSHLDETRPTLMGVILGADFAHAAFSSFFASLNNHDILEQCKQRKIDDINKEIANLDQKDGPHQHTLLNSKSSTSKYAKSLEQIQKNATKRKGLSERISNIRTGVEETKRMGITPQEFYAAAHWDTRAQQFPAYTPLANICNPDELCELACDLTMMEQCFVKLDGKYGGNKGFDGLYMKENMIIAAESKFWAKPPTLHVVISEKIIPKFDFLHNGAIKHIRKEIQDKIKIAYGAQQIYTLPYAMLNNWQVDCRLEHFTGEITFSQVTEKEKLSTPEKREIKKEVFVTRDQHSVASKIKVESTDGETSDEGKKLDQQEIKSSFIKNDVYDISTLTPQSASKDKQDVLGKLLSSFMEQTQMSPADLNIMLGQLNALNTRPILFFRK